MTCKEHDVVEYLNISDRGPLLSMTMPKKDWSEPLIVFVDSHFISLLSMVEKAQTMTTYFWIFMEWKNDFISWNPVDFCNISHITLPMSIFWVPDLFYHEQVVEDTSPWATYVNVTSNGMIKAAKPTRLTSSCILDIYYFPFDIQKCVVTVTSFMHPETSLILKLVKNSSEQFHQSMHLFQDTGEWHLLGLEVEEGTMLGYSKVTCTVIIKRHASMYVFSLVVPVLFFFAMDTLSHFIPKYHIEKINFKITVLLGSSVLALVLNDFLPSSSNEPPIIVIFFAGTTILMIFGIMQMIFILYVGGKIHKPDETSKKRFCFYQGLFEKSCSKEVQPVDEEQESGDHISYLLEMISRDIQMLRQHILSLQNQEKLDKEREDALEKLEMWLYYFHMSIVTTFYIAIIVKWNI